MADCTAVLARDAKEAEIQASDEISEAATSAEQWELATLIYCSLNPDLGDGVGADFVKGFRQRERVLKAPDV